MNQSEQDVGATGHEGEHAQDERQHQQHHFLIIEPKHQLLVQRLSGPYGTLLLTLGLCVKRLKQSALWSTDEISNRLHRTMMIEIVVSALGKPHELFGLMGERK